MPYDLTRDGLISALTPTLAASTAPMFLRDVLRMKRNRGDADCESFKLVAKDFASGLNATIAGSAWAMRQWVAKRPDWIGSDHQARREAFLADIDAVLAGDLAGWDIHMAAA